MANSTWAKVTITSDNGKLTCHLEVFNGANHLHHDFDIPANLDDLTAQVHEHLKRLGYNPKKETT